MKISYFLKSIITLVSGTAAAHLITLAALPIISRLYTKEQFGELAVLMSSSGILAIIMTLKLEVALFNRSKRVEREAIVYTAIVLSLCFLLTLTVTAFVFESRFLDFYKNKLSAFTLFFIPLAAFMIALFNVITNFVIVDKQFKHVAKVKVQRSLAQALLQFCFSIMSIGLVVAETLSRAVGIFSLFRRGLAEKELKTYKVETFIETIKLNKRFLKFTSLAAFFNVASLQIPTLFIAANFSFSGAGIYLMTNRLVALPVNLIGQSMAQVYSSEFGIKKHEYNALIELFKRVVFKSFIFSSVIFILGALLSEWLIVIILGEQWVQVSEFIIILTPMLIFQFSVTPISNTLNMLECQHLMLFWDFFRLSSVLFVTLMTISYNLDVEQFLVGYSIVLSLCYLILLILSWYKLKQKTHMPR
ncbi:hypothetical protein AN214_01198 [Pseudoalteromonas sp. P1-9]|uniref:lipopolysaccharide biosynthesis protein n=1 Tax=Pseudoalteromonas sp. P1-9 TaxID=1710354 RepID=UPI0006D621E9|nr:oligosaccharide flippase family protein [Pseudoalteromonas sp. P1-9]KPV96738.1 hypothetical protein AN214_01198 [Pseudoalteromonas sp. P1-9]